MVEKVTFERAAQKSARTLKIEKRKCRSEIEKHIMHLT